MSRQTSRPPTPSSSAIVVAFVLLRTMSTVAGQGPPTFGTLSPPTSAASGSTLSLYAVASTAQQYTWLKDGIVLSAPSSNPYLSAKNLSKSDTGVYQCIAANAYGSTLSQPINVHVQYVMPWQSPSTPISVTVVNGYAAIMLLPPIDSYPALPFKWQEIIASVSGPVPVRGPSYAASSSGQLLIPQVGAADDGRQFVLTMYSTSGPLTAQYSLHVTSGSGPSQPYFALQLPSTTTAVQGQSAVLECYPNARAARIQWYAITALTSSRQSIDSIMTGRYLLEFDSASLKLTNLVATDSGVYICIATVASTDTLSQLTISTNTSLVVQVAPTFTASPPPGYSPQPGSDFSLQCLATGIPTPSVTWFKDANAVYSSHKYQVFVSNGSLVVLNYSNADSGNYQCFVTNPAGTISAATFVRFQVSPTITSRPPANTVAVIGTNLVLPCSATGYPPPTISWLQGQLPLVGPRYITTFGPLTVVGVTSSDAGTYTCAATNSAGSDYSASSVTVYNATSIFNASNAIVEVLKLSSTSISCFVRTDSRVTASILWYRGSDSTPLVTSSYWELRNSNQTLYIPLAAQQNIGGNYTCQVVSVAGSDARSFSVIVLEVPYPPYSVQASLSALQNRTIQVSWLPPYSGNKPILNYKLFQADPGFLAWTLTTSQIPSTSTTWAVTGLTPSQAYVFTILAVNSLGDGQLSQPSNSVTIPAEPPGAAPYAVSITPTSTTIIIAFTAPGTQFWNGGLLGYYIQYRVAGVAWQQQTYWSTTTGQQTYVLASMIPYQEYYVRLAAFNAQGVGPYTAEYLTKTLDGVPTQPPAGVLCTVLSSTSALVAWGPPTDPTSLNGEIQGYNIYTYQGASAGTQAISTVQVGPNVMQYQFSNLSKFTTYSFTVVVFTRGGSSPASSPVSITTMQDRPSAVNNLATLSVTYKTITVGWSAPASPNGIITAFLYVCLTTNGSPIVNSTLNSTTMSASCENLTSSTTYTIQVTAATVVGQGPANSVQALTLPPPELPGAVSQPSVTSIGSRSVTVRFTPGYDGKAVITAYIVQALVGSSAAWSDIWVNAGSASSFDVQQLQPYTAYTIRIIALNIAGRGAASQTSSPFMTQQDLPAGAPANVTVRPQDSTTLIITWTALLPGEWNGPSQRYVVSYWPAAAGGQASERNVTGGPLARALVLDSLAPWTSYSVQVAASNQLYVGNYSSVVNCSTLESVPAAAPAGVAAAAVNSSTVVVSWNAVPAGSANGFVHSYSVWYALSQDTSSAAVVQVDVTSAAPWQYYLAGLQQCAVYSIRVAASTRAGSGPYSQSVAVQLGSASLPPPTSVYCPVVSTSSVTVAWSPPSTACTVSGYVVSYWLAGSSSQQQSQTLPPDRGQAVITGLATATVYTVSVVATGAGGSGGQAATISVMTTTARGLPSTPTSVTASALTARSASVSWFASDDSRAPIRNYTVQVRQPTSAAAAWTAWGGAVVAPALQCTLSGLQPYAVYEIRVTASNDVGQSTPSASTTLQMPSAAPSAAPGGLQVVPVTASALSVLWDDLPADQWNGQPQQFVVAYRLYYHSELDANVSSAAAGLQVVSYPVLNTTVAGLQPGYVYELRVAAVSDAGKGPLSLPVAIYVGVAVPSAKPGGVQAISAGPNNIVVQWQALAPAQQNGDLLGYKVYYKKISNSSSSGVRTSRSAFSSTFDIVPPEEQQYTIVGLQEFATYAIAVAAFNLAGDGPSSETTFVVTETGVPGRPRSLTANVVALAVANISWNTPASPNGLITGYKLSYYLQTAGMAAAGASGSMLEVLVGGTSCLLQSLSENATYTILIAAHTSAGWGNASSMALSTSAAPGSPAMPYNVQYAQLTTTVSITWTIVDSGQAPVNGFVVEALPKNGAAGDWRLVVQQPSSSAQAVLSNAAILDGQPFDRLRVSVYNLNGVSPAALAAEGNAPFYRQWWFLVMVALIALVVIVSVVAALCCECYRRRAKKAKQAYHNEVFESTEMRAETELSRMETRQSVRRSSQRSQKSSRLQVPAGPPLPPLSFVGSPELRSASMYSDEPPPHYEEEAPSSGASSDTAEKRSLTDDEGDDDEFDDVKKAPPLSDIDEADGRPDSRRPAQHRSGRGGPAGYNQFQYAGHYATPSVRKSWRDRQKTSQNVYSYTDSEADSYYGGPSRREPGSAYQSHPVPGMSSAMRVTLSDANVPGSRAPLPGFSSFV